MDAKTCMWTSIMIFAVVIVLSIVSNFFEGYTRLWISIAACLMLIPGWIFNIIGGVKLSRRSPQGNAW